MSQLGSDISGRSEHWAGVAVPCTGVLTHTTLGTPAANSASLQTKTTCSRQVWGHRFHHRTADCFGLGGTLELHSMGRGTFH